MDSLRFVPHEVADGAHNMAADDVLLDAAADHGVASLRLYGWSEATLSLGYFQAARARQQDAQRARLPWVRRPSGGKTLVHHHELTYALALPPGFSVGWMTRMHERVILPALGLLGLEGWIDVANAAAGANETLCFLQQSPGDLTCKGHKIVGSAQRKHRKALLQHGAILLATSAYAPEVPGIRELAGVELSVGRLRTAIVGSFWRETAWTVREERWSASEETAIRAKAVSVYGTVEWNEKR